MAPNAEPADFWLLLSESFFCYQKNYSPLDSSAFMLWLSHSVDLSSYTLKLLLVFSEDWIGSCFTWLHMSILGKRSTWAGPILESKGMRAIFQKKKAKYLKIWAKMYKIWKHFEKGQPHAWDHRMKQLEYALLRGLGKGGNHDFFLVEPISRIGFLNLYRTYISLPWNLKL